MTVSQSKKLEQLDAQEKEIEEKIMALEAEKREAFLGFRQVDSHFDR